MNRNNCRLQLQLCSKWNKVLRNNFLFLGPKGSGTNVALSLRKSLITSLDDCGILNQQYDVVEAEVLRNYS